MSKYTKLTIPELVECVYRSVLHNLKIEDINDKQIQISFDMDKEDIDDVLEYIRLCLEQRRLENESSKIYNKLEDKKKDFGQEELKLWAWLDEDEDEDDE